VDRQHGEEGERDGPAGVAEATVSSRWRDDVGVVRVEVGCVLLYDLRESVKRRGGFEAEVEGGKSGHPVLFQRSCAHAPPMVPFGFSGLGARVARAVPASMAGSFSRGTYGRRDMVTGASGIATL